VILRWERVSDCAFRVRLPFLDVTVGAVRGRAGVLLVDTGTTLDEAAAVERDVWRLTGLPVTAVVLTHHHFDHVLGSGRFPDARLYCAPGVVAVLAEGAAALRADALAHGADPAQIDRALAALRPASHPVLDAEIDLGGPTVRIGHLGRGHTRADLCVTVLGRDPVVFCGDLVEESGEPAVDADSDVAAWPATLDRLLAVGGEEARYVPGHGAVVDAAFVRRQQTALRRLG
jgi:glyoxylase-like metal-dependent hydrolase (beta-lactamase superfamily II)